MYSLKKDILITIAKYILDNQELDDHTLISTFYEMLMIALNNEEKSNDIEDNEYIEYSSDDD